MSWLTRNLSELVTLQRGHDLPESHRAADGQIPVVGSSGITGVHDVARYPGPGVAIGRSGASIGVATYVKEPYWPLNTCLFVTDFKGNDPRWVYWMLKGIDFVGFNSGSAQPSLNRNYLAGIPVYVPPRDVQAAIAEVLGALDDKIAANEKVIAHADQLALAALEASIGTETTTVGELAQVTMGTSPSGDTFNEDGVGEPFFQGVRDFGIRAPKVRIWTTKPVRTASAGDVLLSVRAPVGRLNRAHENLAIGRGLAAIQALDGDNDLLYYRLRLAEGEWQSFSGDGTLFSSVNRKQIEGIKLRELVASGVREAVSSIEWSLRSMLDESASLAGTRDELLPLLMSGKISVKDAETVVSDAV